MKCCKCKTKIEEAWNFAIWVDPDEKDYCKMCYELIYNDIMLEYNSSEGYYES